jgi:hypothetical protein
MFIEGDRIDGAVLRDAQGLATRWGSDRFAAEFARRELEERWLEAEQTRTSPYAQATPADPGFSGPVDAAVQDAVVGIDRAPLRLLRPAHARHASVPRPPASGDEPKRRRRRGRSAPAPSWTVSPAEVARMTAAARRLYGLDDPADAEG